MAEFSIIDTYFNRPQHHAVDLGVGDDSAVLTPPANQQLVICTDTLVAGRHFPLDTDPHAIGWKSVTVNLSDIAAMGAKPHSILLALSLADIEHDWLKGFSQGLYACCDQFGVSLIGGDTTQSPHLTISVTALGWIESGQAITRAGAQVGDYVCVSGQIGDAAFGLAHLDHVLRKRLDYPTPRCQLGQQLKGLASSMIDVSDGLAQDLGHILQASAVGARVEAALLPALPDLRRALADERLFSLQLAGGDDYELLFTAPQQAREHVLAASRAAGVLVSRIGRITDNSGCLEVVDGNGDPVHLNHKGFDHFG